MNSKKIVASALITFSLMQAPNAFAMGLLRYGSTGQDVVQVQRSLNSIGYNCGYVDGIFGQNTLTAVKHFQMNNNLSVDGIVGPLTYGRLRELTSGTSSRGYANKSNGLLQYGSVGSAVTTLQGYLNKLGYSTGGIDGIFGPATRRAVLNFQASHSLLVDGIVGPQTMNALQDALASSPSRGSYQRSTGNYIVNIAMQYLGTPYVYGGASPSGFDCSGFVQYVYKRAGINIGRDTYAQYHDGIAVSRNNLQPGDIVFFSTDGVGPTHEGLYIGGGRIIQMSWSRQSAIISYLNNPWFSSHYYGARRIID